MCESPASILIPIFIFFSAHILDVLMAFLLLTLLLLPTMKLTDGCAAALSLSLSLSLPLSLTLSLSLFLSADSPSVGELAQQALQRLVRHDVAHEGDDAEVLHGTHPRTH